MKIPYTGCLITLVCLQQDPVGGGFLFLMFPLYNFPTTAPPHPHHFIAINLCLSLELSLIPCPYYKTQCSSPFRNKVSLPFNKDHELVLFCFFNNLLGVGRGEWTNKGSYFVGRVKTGIITIIWDSEDNDIHALRLSKSTWVHMHKHTHAKNAMTSVMMKN